MRQSRPSGGTDRGSKLDEICLLPCSSSRSSKMELHRVSGQPLQGYVLKNTGFPPRRIFIMTLCHKRLFLLCTERSHLSHLQNSRPGVLNISLRIGTACPQPAALVLTSMVPSCLQQATNVTRFGGASQIQSQLQSACLVGSRARAGWLPAWLPVAGCDPTAEMFASRQRPTCTGLGRCPSEGEGAIVC